MIAQLLQREFMLKSMKQLTQTIQQQTDEYEQGDREVRKLMEKFELTVEDLNKAAAEIKSAALREELRAAESLDTMAYFPRDAVVSMAQSALQEFCDKRKRKKLIPDRVRAAGEAQNIGVTNVQMDSNLEALLSGLTAQRALSCDRLGVVVWLSSLFVTRNFDWCRRGIRDLSSYAPILLNLGLNEGLVVFSNPGTPCVDNSGNFH